jgi:plastocyanin
MLPAANRSGRTCVRLTVRGAANLLRGRRHGNGGALNRPAGANAAAAAVISAATVALGLAAAPAYAADVTIENFAFDPTPVTIAPGDSVTWTWAGPDTNHSVTSDSSSAEAFDSDPVTPPFSGHPQGDTFSHTFGTAGSFTYHCQIHSSMHGKVIVQEPGSGPPPDTTPPAITGLKATGGRKCKAHAKHCKGKPTTVRFTLSEAGPVKIASGGKTRATAAGTVGSNSVKLSTKKLGPGKHTLSVTATDAAGNASAPAKVTVRVKRR